MNPLGDFNKFSVASDGEYGMSSVPANPSDPEGIQKQNRYKMRVRNIASAVREGKCILFLGSASHAASPPTSTKYKYPETESPPVGPQLAEWLAKRCDYPDEDRWNLQRVSWYYEWQSGFRSELVREVSDAVHKRPLDEPLPNGETFAELKPSPVLRGLAELNFPIVITTNYDQLYEKALDAAGRPHTKCVYSSDDRIETQDCDLKPSGAKPYLLKIHGDLDQPDSIVITDEDYIQFILRMGDKDPYRPVGEKVRYFLKTWPTLFIGYRLSDYNLRLLFKMLRRQLGEAMIPACFAVDLKPDVLIRETWDSRLGYIRFIEKNLWDFVPDLYEAVTGKEMPS